MKTRIPVHEVKLGMFIRELDRPWLDTPFLFQGFYVTSIEEIEKLKRYCEHVCIDLEKSALRLEPSRRTLNRQAVSSWVKKVAMRRKRAHVDEAKIVGQVIYQDSLPVEQEIETASGVRHDVRRVIDNLYDEARTGCSIDTGYAKAVVEDLTDSIIRNADAHLLLSQLRKRDEYTATHSVNVCTIALAFGRHLGFPRSYLVELGLGAMMHDLGKMKVPLEILNKPSKLTAEEFELIKAHPIYGMEMLLQSSDSLPARSVDIAYTHHERMDGTGYPQGLKGKEIPLFGRMVAIVDVYDAVTSDRIYHDGQSPGDALRDLYAGRRGHFDEELVEQFIRCLSIYPVGSVVECDTGEIGVVIAQNPERRLRPKMLLVRNPSNRAYTPPKIIDLGRFDGNESIKVTRMVKPADYGIDVQAYIGDLSYPEEKLAGHNRP